MSAYLLTWITKNLAVGHAPMSYEELDSLKEQGIDAIVNLCGEFSDLAEIEETAGFQVFWLPIPDETAPKMEEMEKGLEWLDEAIYLGQKGSCSLPPWYWQNRYLRYRLSASTRIRSKKSRQDA